jgi:hypothetical protein
MRAETDYQEKTASNGKKKRVKIGSAAVQRDGLEYELDLIGYMDEDNTLVVDKTGARLTRRRRSRSAANSS